MHPGRHRVAGALHPRKQRIVHLVGCEQRRLPIALFNPGAVDQVKVGHAVFGHGAEQTAQHLGPRQGQNNVEAMAGRRWLVEVHLQHHDICIQGTDAALAQIAIQLTNPDAVAHRSA